MATWSAAPRPAISRPCPATRERPEASCRRRPPLPVAPRCSVRCFNDGRCSRSGQSGRSTGTVELRSFDEPVEVLWDRLRGRVVRVRPENVEDGPLAAVGGERRQRSAEPSHCVPVDRGRRKRATTGRLRWVRVYARAVARRFSSGPQGAEPLDRRAIPCARPAPRRPPRCPRHP